MRFRNLPEGKTQHRPIFRAERFKEWDVRPCTGKVRGYFCDCLPH